MLWEPFINIDFLIITRDACSTATPSFRNLHHVFHFKRFYHFEINSVYLKGGIPLKLRISFKMEWTSEEAEENRKMQRVSVERVSISLYLSMFLFSTLFFCLHIYTFIPCKEKLIGEEEYSRTSQN